MRFNSVLSTTFFCFVTMLAGALAYAQVPRIAMFDRDEETQKRFFSRVMSQYSAEYYVKVDALTRAGRYYEAPQTGVSFEEFDLGSSRGREADALLGKYDWAVDMVIERIKAIRSEPGDGERAVDGLLLMLDRVRRSEALDIVSDRLKDDREYKDLVKRLVIATVGDGGPDDTQLWRRALESKDTVVRELMQRYFIDMCRRPGTRHFEVIVSSIVDRYGHSPTAVEMASDPFFSVLKDGSAKDAQEIKSRLLSGTEKEHLRRQLVPSVVRK